jgi:hypothetical protein
MGIVPSYHRGAGLRPAASAFTPTFRVWLEQVLHALLASRGRRPEVDAAGRRPAPRVRAVTVPTFRALYQSTTCRIRVGEKRGDCPDR